MHRSPPARLNLIKFYASSSLVRLMFERSNLNTDLIRTNLNSFEPKFGLIWRYLGYETIHLSLLKLKSLS